VSPETLHSLVDYPVSVAVLVCATALMTTATWAYLRFVHRWDGRSALYGASPGALAQIMVLSVESGADVRAIIVVQTMRVVGLTLLIPGGLAAFGLVAQAAAISGRPVASPSELLVMVAVSVATALILQKLRFPGGMIFGAMVGSATLHGGGFVSGGLPWGVAATVMVALGTVNGSRFAGTDRRMLLHYVGAAMGSFAVSVGLAVCFASIAAMLVPVPIADIVIAYAPGAQDTMLLLALALKLDPVFVGAHHLGRFLTVSLTVPFIARAMPAAGRSV
jgi:membrane AbrB-like protein